MNYDAIRSFLREFHDNPEVIYISDSIAPSAHEQAFTIMISSPDRSKYKHYKRSQNVNQNVDYFDAWTLGELLCANKISNFNLNEVSHISKDDADYAEALEAAIKNRYDSFGGSIQLVSSLKNDLMLVDTAINKSEFDAFDTTSQSSGMLCHIETRGKRDSSTESSFYFDLAGDKIASPDIARRIALNSIEERYKASNYILDIINSNFEGSKSFFGTLLEFFFKNKLSNIDKGVTKEFTFAVTKLSPTNDTSFKKIAAKNNSASDLVILDVLKFIELLQTGDENSIPARFRLKFSVSKAREFKSENIIDDRLKYIGSSSTFFYNSASKDPCVDGFLPGMFPFKATISDAHNLRFSADPCIAAAFKDQTNNVEFSAKDSAHIDTSAINPDTASKISLRPSFFGLYDLNRSVCNWTPELKLYLYIFISIKYFSIPFFWVTAGSDYFENKETKAMAISQPLKIGANRISVSKINDILAKNDHFDFAKSIIQFRLDVDDFLGAKSVP